MASLIFDRAVLLAKVESVFRVDSSPSYATDALLVGSPDWTPTVTELKRDVVKQDFSPLPSSVGRKMATLTFQHEVRNNGNTDGTTPPTIAALFKACGFTETQVTGASGTISAATPGGMNTGTCTFAKTTAYTGYLPRVVTLTVTTPGGTGVAHVTVASVAVGELDAYSVTGVVVTTGTPITLPGGATITPTVGTSFADDDVWTFHLTPAGYEYTPISDNIASATIYLYRDGLLHILTGARGNVSMSGTAGDYAIFTFTMSGDYNAPTDASMPASPVYETQKPSQTELANLTLDGYSSLACQTFSVDVANTVVVREDINTPNGYAGALITGRAPKVGFNPEATLEGTFAFWAKQAAGTEMAFSVKVGSVKGNVVQVDAPAAQIVTNKYANRNNILSYDVEAMLARVNGNDEIKLSFR